MKCEGKFSILKYIFICLICLIADKADDSLYHTERKTDRCITNEISATAPDHFLSVTHHAFSAPETQCWIPRQTSVSCGLRTFSQAKRPNLNPLKSIITGAKTGNPSNYSLFFISLINFPSGLTEDTHHLISLGKLII